MNPGLFSHRTNPSHRKPALPLAFASDLPGETAFPGAVTGGSFLSYFIMYRYLFRYRFLGLWWFGVWHSRTAFRFRCSRSCGFLDFYCRVFWLEFCISELPF